MSAPVAGMEAGDQPAAAELLEAFKTIDPAERQKHEAVLDYWLSIRGERELPPLRDLDPLEISDAAPLSVLVELIGGGEDAEIRHLGEQLRSGGDFDRISQAPRPSLLSSIARKLSIVAVSRNFLAFEDEFAADGEKTRCWVTLLPLSSAGAWVDYVYAFVSFGPADAAKAAAASGQDEPEAAEVTEAVQDQTETPEVEPEVTEVTDMVVEEVVEAEPEALEVEAQPDAVVQAEPEMLETAAVEPETPEIVAEPEDIADAPEDVLELDSPVEEPEAAAEQAGELPVAEAEPVPTSKKGAGFSFDASAGGFYATKAVNVKPTLPEGAVAKAKAAAPAREEQEHASSRAEPKTVEPVMEQAAPAKEESSKPAAEEKPHKATSATEGSLQSKLTDVRAKADEARMAKLKANVALYEGLSAAYDFALDAEDSPEEYLRIVEAQGLKIQLRSPMRPVVKLAFDGMCDEFDDRAAREGAGLGDRPGAAAWLARQVHRGSGRNWPDPQRTGQGRVVFCREREGLALALRFAQLEPFDDGVDGALA